MSASPSTALPERFPGVWFIANLGLFQAVWWTQILQGVARPALAIAACAAFIAVHLLLSHKRRADLLLLIALLLLGPWLDVLIARLDLLDYRGAAPFAGAPPYWIFGLWMAFSLTLNHSMHGLLQRPWLAILLGAVGGPAAYYTGVKFGAAALPAPGGSALLALALIWALAFGALSLAIKRWTPLHTTAEQSP